eukprot:NODE_1_length_95616_cov_0.657642.p17 type:complete len:396 gc:universal NODE_1_length_95616_cov_0.657642:56647-57834(+)
MLIYGGQATSWFLPLRITLLKPRLINPLPLYFIFLLTFEFPTMQEETQVSSSGADVFKIWKRNTPFLYDKLVSHVLKWPSLTCKNLATVDKEYIVLGTHTSQQESEYIHVYEEGNALKQYQSIVHNREINSLDIMPQNNQIIATKTSDLCIFDRTKHVTHKIDQQSKPELISFSKSEGYAVQFSASTAGQLLVGDDESLKVFHVTDISEQEQLSQKINPRCCYTQEVEDAVWMKCHDSLIVTAGPKSSIFDIRTNKIASKLPGSNAKSCDSHSSLPCTVLLSNNTGIDLYDLRNLNTCLHSFKFHENEVLKCRFSPTHPNIFASIAGNRLMVWDILNCNGMSDDEAPPELLFLHGGHVARISDFDFHPTTPFQFTSVDDENICQVFRIASSIVEK